MTNVLATILSKYMKEVSSFKYCYLSNYEIMMYFPMVSYLIKAGIFKK